MSAPTLIRECRICGCTDDHACVGADGNPCHWVDDDLCSACDQLLADPVIRALAEALVTQKIEATVAERVRQDGRHGGPDHDDTHSQQDWHDILYRLLDEAETAGRAGDDPEYGRVMIQVAASAVAAVQSHDRKLVKAEGGV
ncbi:MAG: hypothetical protein IH626_01680 [Rhodospirillales bacterium]|nr:hypothetical protein [Rhodospirillales bacterium]